MKLKLSDLLIVAKTLLGDVAREGKRGEAARHEAAVRLGRWLDKQVDTKVIDPIDNKVWIVLAELVLDFAQDALDGDLKD